MSKTPDIMDEVAFLEYNADYLENYSAKLLKMADDFRYRAALIKKSRGNVK